uniref:AAA-ATPase-like domain-containing protein n=1 Tax=Ditylenchus dipsaci TaxID=166011 RepID=A0A915CU13_9BILA
MDAEHQEQWWTEVATTKQLSQVRWEVIKKRQDVWPTLPPIPWGSTVAVDPRLPQKMDNQTGVQSTGERVGGKAICVKLPGRLKHKLSLKKWSSAPNVTQTDEQEVGTSRKKTCTKYNHIRVVNNERAVIGTDVRSYESLLDKSTAVVDKTEFSLALLGIKPYDLPIYIHDVTLITSPRRTGKTMLLGSHRFFIEMPVPELNDLNFYAKIKKIQALLRVPKEAVEPEKQGRLDYLIKCIERHLLRFRTRQEYDHKFFKIFESTIGELQLCSEVESQLIETFRLIGECHDSTMTHNDDGQCRPIENRRARMLKDGGFRVTSNKAFGDYCGSFPVIWLDFFQCGGPTYDICLNTLKEKIRLEFCRHTYLRDYLVQHDPLLLNIFDSYVSGNFDEAALVSSVTFLSEILYNVFAKKVVIILDEYDYPLNHMVSSIQVRKPPASSGLSNLFKQTFLASPSPPEPEVNAEEFDNFKHFYDRFFAACFKSNTFFHHSVIAGTLPHALGEMSSLGISAHSIAESDYSKFLMLSEEELMELCHFYGLVDPDRQLAAKAMYDGYVVKVEQEYCQMYNTSSVVKYLNRQPRPQVEVTLPSFFSEGNKMSQFDSAFNSDAMAFTFLQLLEAMDGEAATTTTIAQYCSIGPGKSLYPYDIKQLKKAETKDIKWLNKDDGERFLRLLFYSGYLTMAIEKPRDVSDCINLRIPNKELSTEFRGRCTTFSSAYPKRSALGEDFLVATQILAKIQPPGESAKKCDVFVYHKPTNCASILELKWNRSNGTEEALKQCEDKNYAQIFGDMEQQLDVVFKQKSFIAASLSPNMNVQMKNRVL